ncbi:MAG: hypothetical protein JWP54_948 [Cryobacterium sp.]|nr:hypothetical protein [Cryobacterium sp.]
MTLGNSPQPLTRRQLRELARDNEPAVAESAPDAEANPPADVPPHSSRHTSPPVERPAPVPPAADTPASVKPAPVKPAPVKPAPVKPASVAKPQRAEQPAVKPAGAKAAPAPLPIPEEAPARNAVVIDSVVVDPGHALTRRELRALQAAASASAAQSSPPPAAAASAAPGNAAPAAERAPTVRPASESTPVPTASEAPADSTGAANGLHPPVGHWSVDRDDDSHIETVGRRDDQTFDDFVGRGIGAGGIPTTTNALILPAIPRQGAAGPITSTGEIMITGSIDLPRSLGATGQHPNLFDSSEMDRMLDQLDEAGHHNDVAPVSASRAVSTHTSTRGVMTPPRKRGASLPTVLAITAALLAIGVLSLFVVGYAFNIY